MQIFPKEILNGKTINIEKIRLFIEIERIFLKSVFKNQKNKYTFAKNKTMNYNANTSNQGRGAAVLKIAVIALGIMLLGLGYYTYSTYKELSAQNDLLTDQKEQIINELDELKIDYDQKIKQNSELSGKVEEAKKRIETLKEEIQKQKKITARVLRKYKREIARLKVERDKLYKIADSLRLANQQLTVEKDSLAVNLDQQKQFNDTLLNKNEELSKTLNKAKILYPTNIHATGVKIRKSGKVIETSRKWRTQQIRVCFTIPKNDILDAGKQVFFVRVVNPDGKVLGTLDTIEVDGNQVQISNAEEVVYENKALQVCSFVKPNDEKKEIIKGDYLVEIYQNGVKVGTTHMTLK